MLKAVAGVIGAIVAWAVVATVVNMVFRLTWPEYAQLEPTMKFTLVMLLARLALGALFLVSLIVFPLLGAKLCASRTLRSAT